ncbi:MAG: DUF932 domain-containing protein [Verrucomicrobiota bacterium]
MNAVIDQPVVSQKPPKGMLLHCGAELVSKEQLWEVPTPNHTDTWYPLPHFSVLTEVRSQLVACGFIITEEAHALSHDGQRYFGVLNITVPGRGIFEWSWAVAVRNSHDKTFPAGLVAGTKVFCCDNLAFSGEVQIARKHTRYAERDLRHLTARAVGQLGGKLHDLDHRILTYNETPVNDQRAHDIVVRGLDAGVITSTQVPEVLKEWREPSHAEFTPRTAWSLFNAFTETHKKVNPHTAVRRGEALYGLFDGEMGAFSAN